MLEEFQEEQQKKVARVRSVMDFTMGILLVVLGCFFLIYGELGIKLRGKEHTSLDYVIGAIFIVYGIWRVYRGYKKDYYR